MKKKIKDCTFKEFTGWANARACDGRWSMQDAIVCMEVCRIVYNTTPILFANKAREKVWKNIRGDYLDLEAEIEIER
jgi:hypothetical protein